MAIGSPPIAGRSSTTACSAGKAGRRECLAGATDCPLLTLLSDNWSGALSRNEPLAPLTTLRVGGPAAVLARPASLSALAELLAILARRGCPKAILGRGSNLLVADRGYAGVVILLGRQLAKIEELPAGAQTASPDCRLVRVEAGCSLAKLLHWAEEQSLTGLEFLVGIPGSVGGAVVMNAGAHGQALGDAVVELAVITAAGSRRIAGQQLQFTYRSLQGLAAEDVVGAVTLALRPGAVAEIRVKKEHYQALRQAGQPRGVASAGSFFKNPPGDYAGRLIEQAGLKGVRVGDAEVSPVHANFLVNRGQASAADLLALMRLVQAKVLTQYGVELEPEVHFLGFEQ